MMSWWHIKPSILFPNSKQHIASEKQSIHMKLIVGLGNPGKDYASSRHNLGFRCVNRLAKQNNISIDKRQCRARTGVGTIAGSDLILAKPQTYMNRSGESVSLLIKRFDIAPEDLLIIYDDLDLPLGKIRLRPEGSSGGHKGIESIIACLGHGNFSRLRVGISRPEGEHDTINHVLGKFSPSEKDIVEENIRIAAEAVCCYLAEGITAAMNKYN